VKETQHWSEQKEHASGYWVLKFSLILFRLFPVIILRLIAFPVGFFYFIFAKNVRAESKRFLGKVAGFAENEKTAKKYRSFFGPLKHIVSFSLNLVDKWQGWGGKKACPIEYQDDDIDELVDDVENSRGIFLVTSHMGNMELLRGLASLNKTRASRKIPLLAIMDMEVNAHYSRMLKELNPQSVLDIVSAYSIGPHTAALLDEKLAEGGMITITGDRTPPKLSASSSSKNFAIPFLGEEAPFPQGPFYLAALLEAPAYFIFGLRQKDLSLKPKYNMHVHKYIPPQDIPPGKKGRLMASSAMAASFAALLERYCKEKPFQWYNFYNFWQSEE